MTSKQCCEIFNSSTLPLDTLPSHIGFIPRQLVEQTINDPQGNVSFTIYGTVRAGVLPPALQPKDFLEFILRNQNEDGSWGVSDVYRIMPTLAMT